MLIPRKSWCLAPRLVVAVGVIIVVVLVVRVVLIVLVVVACVVVVVVGVVLVVVGIAVDVLIARCRSSSCVAVRPSSSASLLSSSASSWTSWSVAVVRLRVSPFVRCRRCRHRRCRRRHCRRCHPRVVANVILGEYKMAGPLVKDKIKHPPAPYPQVQCCRIYSPRSK